MPLLLRTVSVEDEDPLRVLDEAYSARHDLEPVISVGSLNFFARSGHSFVAEEHGRPAGVVLGQAIWDGNRPFVLVDRLIGVQRVREPLLEALTKSAYDAGVYDISVRVPVGDEEAMSALRESGYRAQRMVLYERVLGSRAAQSRGDSES